MIPVIDMHASLRIWNIQDVVQDGSRQVNKPAGATPYL